MVPTYFFAGTILVAGISVAIYGARKLRRERIYMRIFEFRVHKLVADLEKEVQP